MRMVRTRAVSSSDDLLKFLSCAMAKAMGSHEKKSVKNIPDKQIFHCCDWNR